MVQSLCVLRSSAAGVQITAYLFQVRLLPNDTPPPAMQCSHISGSGDPAARQVLAIIPYCSKPTSKLTWHVHPTALLSLVLRRAMSAGPQAGMARAMSGPQSPGSAVVPHYLEGSVHRQQQLMRLIPPKRAHSSLDLTPEQVGRVKSQRTKDPSWHGPGSLAAAAAAAHAGASATDGGAQTAAPGASSRVLAAAAAARLEGTWHGPSNIGRRSFEREHSLSGWGAGVPAGGVQGSEGSDHDTGLLEGSLHSRGMGSWRGAVSALEALRRARERKSHAEGLAQLAAAKEAPPSLSGTLKLGGDAAADAGAAHAAAGLPHSSTGVDSNGPAAAGQHRASFSREVAAAAAAGADAGHGTGAEGGVAGSPGADVSGGDVAGAGSYHGPIRDLPSASLWDLQFMANRLAMEGSGHGNAYTHTWVTLAFLCGLLYLFSNNVYVLAGGYLSSDR